MKNRTTRILILLIAVIFLAAVAACVILYFQRSPGAKVLVTVDGVSYGEYDLNKDQTIRIEPEDHAWHNVLTISHGTAAITESDCSNQICVLTPALQENILGIIVCLPHGVVVELQE